MGGGTPQESPGPLDVLLSGAAEVIPVQELEQKLGAGQPLRVKLGIDPSRPDLHLGHAVVLRKLRQFQDLGHTAVLIIGDFTGLVGDPTGQSETRPLLTSEEMEENAGTYLEQAGKVLDMDRAEVRRNSEWLAGLTFADVIRLAEHLTVARLLERDDFSERYRAGKSISLVEFLYPLMQGYDSVAVGADVEMGGTDQTFNLLVGRDIQRAHGQAPQVVFTMPLLTGTDGAKKMSKSFGNHVGLTEPPEEQFGKVMSIPDELIGMWFGLCTLLEPDEVDAVERGLADGSLHPAEQKRRLAREIVALYHGEGAARTAEERFDARHRRQEIPTEGIPSYTVLRNEVFRNEELHVPSLLVALNLAHSKSEGQRLLKQEGVRAKWPGWHTEKGERISAEWIRPSEPEYRLVGSVWSVGRRHFARVSDLR